MNGTTELRGDDLAYATLDHIREHPQEWDQGTYFCGTTACFAGRAILLACAASGGELRLADSFARTAGDVIEASRRASSFARTAGKLLGWSEAQARHVFCCYTRDFTVLEQAVKDVLNGDVT